MGFKQFSQESQAKEASKQVENMYNSYKDKSEDELITELINHVAKQKQNGTFDMDNLEQMLAKVRPFLNEKQRQKLQDVLKQIENM